MANFYANITLGAGNDDGSDWANAWFTISKIQTWWASTASAGDTLWIKTGTYTLTTSINTLLDGTIDSTIKNIGVKAATTNEPPIMSDWATSDSDKPSIVCGANLFQFDNYWQHKMLKIAINTTNGFKSDLNTFVDGCIVTNNSGTPNQNAFTAGDSIVTVVNSIFECTNGEAITCSIYTRILNSYIKDSNVGVLTSNNANMIINSIVNGCTTGINGAVSDYFVMDYSIVYDCITGFTQSSTEQPGYIRNSSFSGCADALKLDYGGTARDTLFLDYNNWFDNTHDISVDNGTSEDNSMKGPNATAVDPLFTNAGADDFTLQSGSTLRNAGMPLLNGVG